MLNSITDAGAERDGGGVEVMRFDSPEYAALQFSWSRAASYNIKDGAIGRVATVVQQLTAADIPIGNVLVVGPQHGFELQAWKSFGASNVIGCDVCREFVEDCTNAGFRCEHGPAERLTNVIDENWNVYSCHTIEHFADRTLGVRQMQLVTDRWMVSLVPIEPAGPTDKAHLSHFARENELTDLFVPEEWDVFLRWFQRSKDKLGGMLWHGVTRR